MDCIQMDIELVSYVKIDLSNTDDELIANNDSVYKILQSNYYYSMRNSNETKNQILIDLARRGVYSLTAFA